MSEDRRAATQVRTNWDDAAFADGALKFDVIVRRGIRNLSGFEDEHTASIVVTLQGNAAVLRIEADGVSDAFEDPPENWRLRSPGLTEGRHASEAGRPQTMRY